MADTVKTTRSLRLLAAFADEDDRTLTITNPKGNITASQVQQLGQAAINVLIGDKYGAAFTRFKEAVYVDKAITDIDMSL